MGKPIVNSCCCGCTLEQGGKIIAWIGMIIYGIVIALTLVAMILGLFLSCSFKIEGFDLCSYGTVAIIFGGLLIIALLILFFFIFFLLLQACNEQSSGKVLPVLILYGIGSVSMTIRFLAVLFSLQIGLIIFTGLFLALVVYIFIVLLSLYFKLREGGQPGTYGSQYTAPGMVVQPIRTA